MQIVKTLGWVILGMAQVASMSGKRAPSVALPARPVSSDHDLTDKILGIAGPFQPARLNQKAQFRQYLLFTAGPLPILGELAGSGINQWTNTPPEWGQGWGAYGKRLGSNLAYN